MYEGAPDTPARDRFWDLIERHGVTILYTAPTAIRAFMKWGTEWPEKHDLSSLRLLGSVGEPINPEAWMWYREHIGQRKVPDRRHLVADGDRDDPHHAAARRHDDAPRLRHARLSRDRGEDPRYGGPRGEGRRGIPGDHAAVARDAPHDLGRRRALRRRRTGPAGGRTSTSRATAPSATRTATSGSSAAWTTS